jgi:hypothetical protein
MIQENFFAELKRRNVYKGGDCLRHRGLAPDLNCDPGDPRFQKLCQDKPKSNGSDK